MTVRARNISRDIPTRLSIDESECGSESPRWARSSATSEPILRIRGDSES